MYLQAMEKYVVVSYAGAAGPVWVFDLTQSGFANRTQATSLASVAGGAAYGPTIVHILDPFSALLLGLCTPEDLLMPESFKALFNIMRGKHV